MSQSVKLTASDVGTSYAQIGGVFSAADSDGKVTATVENTSDSTALDAQLRGRHLVDGGTSPWIPVGSKQTVASGDEPHSWIIEPEYDQYQIRGKAQSGTVDINAYFRP